MIKNETRLYTSGEILEIFIEQHRLCSPLDVMADESFELTRDTKIWEWQDALDLLPWHKLIRFIYSEFNIKSSNPAWDKVWGLENDKTLGNLCDYLATVAEQEIVAPVKRLGAECMTAAVFLTLKKNLKNKGVDVSDLRPSTLIEPFLDKNFSPLVEEVTTTGVKTFDVIAIGKLKTERQYKYWIDKIIPRYTFTRPLMTGEIQTFRDLVNKIVEGLQLTPVADSK